MRIINTWLNHRETEHAEELNTSPSETQPNEVMSIKEMLMRHVQGLPLNGAGNEQYYDEEFGVIPDIRSLDLTEIEEYRDYYQERAKQIEAELTARSKKQKSGEADKPKTSDGHSESESDQTPEETT